MRLKSWVKFLIIDWFIFDMFLIGLLLYMLRVKELGWV